MDDFMAIEAQSFPNMSWNANFRSAKNNNKHFVSEFWAGLTGQCFIVDWFHTFEGWLQPRGFDVLNSLFLFCLIWFLLTQCLCAEDYLCNCMPLILQQLSGNDHQKLW